MLTVPEVASSGSPSVFAVIVYNFQSFSCNVFAGPVNSRLEHVYLIEMRNNQ